MEKDETLPQRRRLRKRRDFQRVERKGTRRIGKAVIMLSQKGSGRLGLTVSSKVGNAVVRNLIKRRLREILRKEKPSWVDKDLVLIALPSSPSLSFQELRADVLRLLNR